MAVYKVVSQVAVLSTDQRLPAMKSDTIKVVRLVEAKTKAQAIAHVVADTIAAEVCEIADAVKLGAEGVQIETAGDGGAA